MNRVEYPGPGYRKVNVNDLDTPGHLCMKDHDTGNSLHLILRSLLNVATLPVAKYRKPFLASKCLFYFDKTLVRKCRHPCKLSVGLGAGGGGGGMRWTRIPTKRE